MTAPPDRLIAALADRYTIERELGQGGMATVYLAHDLKHDRRVAIKVLKPELAAVLGAERFVQEIKTTAALQHPHILPLFDSGVADGFPYYVMPFIEGETLRAKLDRDTQLGIDEAVKLTIDVADALHYAHSKGVIHRDIKPENILLANGRPMVADFGIALAVSNAGGARLTQTGLSLGTPQYMSPEQATGERSIGGRTDVYSLGCVLYEMLVGEPPFTGANAQAIVARVLTEPVRPIRGQRNTVSPTIEAAVLKAVQKLPADRFATPQAFGDALQDGDRPTPPTETAADGSAGHKLTNHRSGWMATMALCVLVGVAAFLIGRRAPTRSGLNGVAYSGELLTGPLVAMFPRVSPDGKSVAFAGLVDHEPQVGVLNPESGDWKILTHDTTQGAADGLAWAPDGSRIYYERYSEIPRGVYSVSPLGGDERLILADAGAPAPLADGSILVWRFNADRRIQLHRFWPQSGRLDTLPAFATQVEGGRLLDVFPGGREAAFIGGTGKVRTVDTLFAIDLESRKTRVISANAAVVKGGRFAVTVDGRSVLIVKDVRDESCVSAIPRDGGGQEASLMCTTAAISGIDAGADGSIYVDQIAHPAELLRYTPATGNVEREPTAPFLVVYLPLADGRVLTVRRLGGQNRVVVIAPGKDPVPFLATNEPSFMPGATLGPDRVILRSGLGSLQSLTIAYTATGQIAARIPGFHPFVFAGSPDGKTIYYVDSAAVWAMPSSGGRGRRLHDGDGVAVDPQGKYLVIQVIGKNGVHLLHFPLDGTPPSDIPVRSPLRISSTLLTPNAIRPDGRIVVEIVSPASWFWPAAILDPETGALSIVPPGAGYDMIAGWSPDGKVVTPLLSLEARLWRFRPVKATQ